LADVFSQENETGPFYSCVHEVRNFVTYVDSQLKEAQNRNYTDPDVARMFKENWMSISTHSRKFFLVGEDSNIFGLLDTFISVLDSIFDKVSKENNKSSIVTSFAETFVAGIKTKSNDLKLILLGHPINIVLGAFLLDNHMIYDFGRVPNAESWRVRDPEWFVVTFPLDYLTLVYKMSVDAYLRHRTKIPQDEDFVIEIENMEVYRTRARSDVANVCDIRVFVNH